MHKNYAIVTVPVAPIRKTPHHRKEMSNQLLFGELVQIIQNKENQWLKVKSLYDGYTGWLTHHLITAIDPEMALQSTTLLSAQFLTAINFNGQTMHIPMASWLPNLKKGKGSIAGIPYTCKATPVNTIHIRQKRERLLQQARLWINTPYLWGGKTVLGVDCSGFAQTIYKLVGLPLLRDAWQQAEQGVVVPSLKKAAPADLAFFEDKEEIVHVGILLNNKSIIHAAGKVRIDTIDNKGIINSDTGVRTHRLKLIRRFID